jgi:hypothetical protein
MMKHLGLWNAQMRIEQKKKERGGVSIFKCNINIHFHCNNMCLTLSLSAASFELMRKEHHKAMQGKKNALDILKENPSDDIISQLQTSTEKTNTKTKNEKLDGSAVSSVYQENAAKTSSVLPPLAARPLVPPGFANAFVEKKLQSQSSNISLEPKVIKMLFQYLTN